MIDDVPQATENEPPRDPDGQGVSPFRPDPTAETYGPIQRAYEFFNQRLFGGELPGALITLRSERKSMGYFSGARFGTHKNQVTDELALNPMFFGVAPIEDTLSTVVHEQVHQLQMIKRTAGRARYHNADFAKQMRDRGLEASSTGKPGGKTVGEQMDHYIIEGGPFDVACKELIDSEFTLAWFDRFPPMSAIGMIGKPVRYPPGAKEVIVDDDGSTIEPPPEPSFDVIREKKGGATVAQLPGITFGTARPRSKVKYTCPACKANAWGKPGLQLICGKDQEAFESEVADASEEDD